MISKVIHIHRIGDKTQTFAQVSHPPPTLHLGVLNAEESSVARGVQFLQVDTPLNALDRLAPPNQLGPVSPFDGF
eukprot:2853741-Heterocapsa_arctica.AAC.1